MTSLVHVHRGPLMAEPTAQGNRTHRIHPMPSTTCMSPNNSDNNNKEHLALHSDLLKQVWGRSVFQTEPIQNGIPYVNCSVIKTFPKRPVWLKNRKSPSTWARKFCQQYPDKKNSLRQTHVSQLASFSIPFFLCHETSILLLSMAKTKKHKISNETAGVLLRPLPFTMERNGPHWT